MDKLTIVVSTDNHFIVLLAALLKSLEGNLAKGKQLHIYIISDNVTNRNKQRLQSSISAAITQLSWVEMNDVIPKGMQLPVDGSSYPLNIYMRLFIPYFVPNTIDKVLYLDVDMIVQNDVSILFDTDLSNHVLAAVLDPRIITFNNNWGGVFNYEALGIAGDTRYFNTGILLMNTAKWRAENVTERIISCIENNKKFANYPDQYGLNVVLANQWLELDPRWNHFSTIDPTVKPYLIHFVERKPIYQSYNYNADFKNTFYAYLNQTAWKNFQPIGESSRYIKKINNLLEKFKKKLFPTR